MSQSRPRISRRELLRRGALVGAGALWVSPVVQTVGMGRAFAAATSPQCTVHTITWVPGIPGFIDPFWRDGFEVGCLGVPADNGLPANIDQFQVTFEDEYFTVTYPDTCTLLPSGDPSPDDLVDGSAALSLLGAPSTCSYVRLTDQVNNGDGTFSIEFGPWTLPQGLARIELVIKCCE